MRPGETWERYHLSEEWLIQHRWAGFVQEAEFSEGRLAKVERQCKIVCIRNLDKCRSFAVAYGLPSDPGNKSPAFVLSEKPTQVFTCSLFSRTIDVSLYQRDAEAGTWTHFRGVNVACTSPP